MSVHCENAPDRFRRTTARMRRQMVWRRRDMAFVASERRTVLAHSLPYCNCLLRDRLHAPDAGVPLPSGVDSTGYVRCGIKQSEHGSTSTRTSRLGCSSVCLGASRSGADFALFRS